MLSFLLVLCASMLLAQENCYETQRTRGIQLYNQGDYAAASKNFIAAKSCTDAPSNNDLDAWIAKCTIVVRISPRRLEFASVGAEEQCVEVSTNAKSFRVGNTPSWCKVTQQGKMLYVSCSDNGEVNPRETSITVFSGGKTAVLEVVQRSADLEMTFDPEALVFNSQAETRWVTVTANVADWQVDEAPNWLVAVRHEDSLMVTAQNNASSDLRSTELILSAKGQTFSYSVSQLPGDTVVSFGEKKVVVPTEGGNARVAVNSNVTGWTVEPSDTWMQVAKEPGAVEITVKENPSVFSRHGVVRVRSGEKTAQMDVYQSAYVTEFTMPASELAGLSASDKESIAVTSKPSNLRVTVDDSITRYTPFSLHVDYEHHSLLMGFERREYLFNDKQQDIAFLPGLRFAELTYSKPKRYGLMTGFVAANAFGAFAHFQADMPRVKEFDTDAYEGRGYHLAVGPLYRPIPYLGIYAGVGFGVYGGRNLKNAGFPLVGVDYEAGLMGFYRNVMLSMGFFTARMDEGQQSTVMLLGLGGYLKRFHDNRFGYCASDSRRWWSVSYVTRPVVNGKGVMFGDLGKEKARAYLKALYIQSEPTTREEAVRNVDASGGVLFTPVNGLIDVCIGVGAEVNLQGLDRKFLGVGAEAGVILNLWRFPLTVMLHESDLLHERHPYVDFGIGFHFGEFKRSSYK